ncbi:MAG: hypothetical protein V1819_02465 [bacterium]
MDELSLVLQKEQEVKEKIETAQKSADLALQEKKLELEKKLNSISPSPSDIEQLSLAKEKKFQAIKQLFEEKTKKGLEDVAKIKKEKLGLAVDYLVEKILCLK